ncbi:MAG: PTS sugar transporter subunit IIC [bacterium]
MICWAVLSVGGDGLLLGPLLSLALLGAVLTLDDTALAQTWLSQPLPAALLAGMVCGAPLTGLMLGIPFQLVTLGNLPVGQSFFSDKVSAVVAGVGAAALSGQTLSFWPGATTMTGASGMLGWILLAMVLCSFAGHWSIQLERRAFVVWMQEGHRSLRDGKLRRFDLILLRCLATTALRGFGLSLLWLCVLVLVWIPVYQQLPSRLQDALAIMPMLVPPLAVGILLNLYGAKRNWVWMFGGFLLAFGLIRFLV